MCFLTFLKVLGKLEQKSLQSALLPIVLFFLFRSFSFKLPFIFLNPSLRSLELICGGLLCLGFPKNVSVCIVWELMIQVSLVIRNQICKREFIQQVFGTYTHRYRLHSQFQKCSTVGPIVPFLSGWFKTTWIIPDGYLQILSLKTLKKKNSAISVGGSEVAESEKPSHFCSEGFFFSFQIKCCLLEVKLLLRICSW